MGRRVGGAGWRCPHPTPPCKPAGGGSEVQTWQEEPGGVGGELGVEQGGFSKEGVEREGELGGLVGRGGG